MGPVCLKQMGPASRSAKQMGPASQLGDLSEKSGDGPPRIEWRPSPSNLKKKNRRTQKEIRTRGKKETKKVVDFIA